MMSYVVFGIVVLYRIEYTTARHGAPGRQALQARQADQALFAQKYPRDWRQVPGRGPNHVGRSRSHRPGPGQRCLCYGCCAAAPRVSINGILLARPASRYRQRQRKATGPATPDSLYNHGCKVHEGSAQKGMYLVEAAASPHGREGAPHVEGLRSTSCKTTWGPLRLGAR